MHTSRGSCAVYNAADYEKCPLLRNLTLGKDSQVSCVNVVQLQNKIVLSLQSRN